jgi:transcriptional regulator of acetoin/glycerol metabolism
MDELVPELVTARLGGGRVLDASPLPSEDSETMVEAKKPIPSQADLEGLLALHRGNLSHVARAVGRSRMQVYRWLEKYGIDASAYRMD